MGCTAAQHERSRADPSPKVITVIGEKPGVVCEVQLETFDIEATADGGLSGQICCCHLRSHVTQHVGSESQSVPRRYPGPRIDTAGNEKGRNPMSFCAFPQRLRQSFSKSFRNPSVEGLIRLLHDMFPHVLFICPTHWRSLVSVDRMLCVPTQRSAFENCERLDPKLCKGVDPTHLPS